MKRCLGMCKSLQVLRRTPAMEGSDADTRLFCFSLFSRSRECVCCHSTSACIADPIGKAWPSQCTELLLSSKKYRHVKPGLVRSCTFGGAPARIVGIFSPLSRNHTCSNKPTCIQHLSHPLALSRLYFLLIVLWDTAGNWCESSRRGLTVMPDLCMSLPTAVIPLC